MDTIGSTVQQRLRIDDFDKFASGKKFYLFERNIVYGSDFSPSYFGLMKNDRLVGISSSLISEIKYVKSTVNGIVKSLKIKSDAVYDYIMTTQSINSLMWDSLLYSIDIKFKQRINSADIKLKKNIMLALYKQSIGIASLKKEFHGVVISWIAKNWSAIMIENLAICSYLKNFICDNNRSGQYTPKRAWLSLAVHRSMIVSIYCYTIEQCYYRSNASTKCDYNENGIDKLIEFVIFYSIGMS